MRDLGDGLVLRPARAADAAELADLQGTEQFEPEVFSEPVAQWTRDLFELPHPTFRPERDVTVVEDTATGRLVSSVVLLPQTWSYAGVPVPVGQPELVATRPQYRRRGLVREQFRVIHEWSAAAGHRWQFITGIEWYYRQFGYSYALSIPPLPMWWVGEAPPEPASDCQVRPATPADVPFLVEVEAAAMAQPGLAVWRGAGGWELELVRRPQGMLASEVVVIERRSGDGAGGAAAAVGYAVLAGALRDGVARVWAFALRPGQEWLGPTAAVLAHIRSRPVRAIGFLLPDGHPVLRIAARRISLRQQGHYGLYVRAPDLVALLRTVGPALEARLAASPAVGFTGSLTVDLYTEALRLDLVDGRLEAIVSVAAGDPSADARCLRDAFIELVLGNRTLAELERAVADCVVVTDAGALLLDVLFPRLPLSLWEIG